MKSVLISNPVWGKKYCKDFCNYSLKSLLYKGNIDKLKKKYKITLYVLTTKDDVDFIKNNKYFNLIPKEVSVKFHIFKKKVFSKFSTITKLQNISISYSKPFNYIIFNYADFIWANFSLTNVVDELNKSKKNFLTFFCLPVKGNNLKKFIRSNNEISVKKLRNFSLYNLHRYATLRFWNDLEFTLTPTFIIFPLKKRGIIVSAYHQTILAASTNQNNKLLRSGIKGITLDEYFSSVMDRSEYKVIKNPDTIMISALCFGTLDSEIPSKSSREDSIKWCFKRFNHYNRKLSQNLIYFSTADHFIDLEIKNALRECLKIIKDINSKYSFSKISQFFLTNYLVLPYTEIILKIYRMTYSYLFKFKHILFSVINISIYIYGKSINWTIYYFLFIIFKRSKTKNNPEKPELFNILKQKFLK